MNASFKAPLFAVSAAFCFASMGACVRGLDGVPAMPAVVARSAIGLVVAIALHLIASSPFKAVNKPILLLRVLAGSAALITFFESLRRIDLGTATLLIYSCPIYVSLFARIFLKEPIHGRAILGLFLGVGGVLIIVVPTVDWSRFDGSDAQTGVLFGIAASLSSAVAYTCLRHLSKTDDSLSIVTAFTVTSLLVATPLAGAELAVWPGWFNGALLLGAGLFGAGGQLALTSAYRHGEASRVSILSLVQVIFAFAISLWLFQAQPRWTTFLGGVLVIAGALLQVKFAKQLDKT